MTNVRFLHITFYYIWIFLHEDWGIVIFLLIKYFIQNLINIL